MKMGAGIFWGAIIMLVGLLIILNVIFGVSLPVFKIVIGLFFIYLGVRILFGGPGWPVARHGAGDVILHAATITDIEDQKQYTTLFGKSVLDFRGVTLARPVTRIEVHSVFGSADILLDPGLPVRITSDAAFGAVQLPDRTVGGFGSTTYTSPGWNEQTPYVAIHATAVFGNVLVKQAR